MKHFASLYLSLAAAIWGIMYVSSKYVMDYIPPFTLVSLRFFIAFLFFTCIALISKRSPRIKRGDLKWFILAGLIGYAISIGAQFLGTKLTSAHMGSLVTALSPAFILIFALLILKETISHKQIISLIIASLGVGIVSWDKSLLDVKGTQFVGIGILILAALTWGLYSVLSKWIATTYSPLTIQLYGSLFGLLFIVPFSFIEDFDFRVLANGVEIWGNVLFLGIISTAGAFYFWNKGFQYIDAGKASLYFFLQPIIGTLLGWLVLGEKITLSFIIGGILIFLGLLFNKENRGASTTHTDRAI